MIFEFHTMSNKCIDVTIPPLVLKENAEMECWREFILRFEIALINTNIAISKDNQITSLSKEEKAKAIVEEELKDFKRGGLLINSIGDEGYRIFARWNIPASAISYRQSELVGRFKERFESRQNLFVTRHRFLSLEQLSSELIEDFLDRVTGKARYYGKRCYIPKI